MYRYTNIPYNSAAYTRHDMETLPFIPKKVTCQHLNKDHTHFYHFSSCIFDIFLKTYFHSYDAIFICLSETFAAFIQEENGSLELCDVCRTQDDVLSAVWMYFSRHFRIEITPPWMPLCAGLARFYRQPLHSLKMYIYIYIYCTDPIPDWNSNQCNAANNGGNAHKAIDM